MLILHLPTFCWGQEQPEVFNHFQEKETNIYLQQKSHDLLRWPPDYSCDDIDATKKSPYASTTPRMLFAHTDADLERFFPNRSFITGFASLAQTNAGYKIMDLTVSVLTPKAADIFGSIEAWSYLVLDFLDGTTLSIQNIMADTGSWNVSTQSYHYTARYVIGQKEERLLRSKELDKILVRWSKVQDQYEIFELDFFINQFYCLENQ